MSAAPAADTAAERTPPPIAPLATLSLALVVIGGVVVAASFPALSLGAPIALLVLSAVCLLIAMALLARQHEFAWHAFARVGRWALLAYAISAAMIEFAFVHNGMSGAPLLVVSSMLVMFAADVAFIIAFTAARYQTD